MNVMMNSVLVLIAVLKVLKSVFFSKKKKRHRGSVRQACLRLQSQRDEALSQGFEERTAHQTHMHRNMLQHMPCLLTLIVLSL